MISDRTLVAGWFKEGLDLDGFLAKGALEGMGLYGGRSGVDSPLGRNGGLPTPMRSGRRLVGFRQD